MTSELRDLVTPVTSFEWVDKVETKIEKGVETIVEDRVQKFIVKWDKQDSAGEYHLPNTAEQLSWIDRSGGGKDVDIKEDNGRFLVTALFFCTLKAYSPSNEKNFDDMMRILIDSPTAKKSHNTYSASSAQGVKMNLKKHIEGLDKYKYMGNAYFKGATPENQYTPDNPPAVVLEDSFSFADKSIAYGTEMYIYKVSIKFSGADTERHLSVYKDKEDGQWYIFSNSFMGFTTDIKRPHISAEEVAPYIKKIEYLKSDQPIVNIKEVNRKAQDPNNSTRIVDQPVTQANILFTNKNNDDVFPDTAEKLAKIDRSGPYGDLDHDKGRFITIAAYFAALKSWTPQNANEINKMMELLCISPTTKALDKQVFNAFDKSFMRDNLSKTLVENTPKYKYLGNSYFDGANPYNEFQPKTPLAVTVEDYVYNGVWSDIYQTTIYRVVSRFDGADSERCLSVYQDPFDHQWYIFSDSYKAFITDIRNPILSEQKVIELYKKKYKFYAKELSFNESDQPKITIKEVDRQYCQEDNEGKTMIHDIKIPQASITFNNDVLPKNVNELKKINRGGNYELAKGGIVKDDKSDNLGRFITAAAYISALKKIDKYNYNDAYGMIELLCASPTSCALGSSVFNNVSQKFIKDNVIDKEMIPKHPKYEYLGNSYFDGATRFNNYTPSKPLTITLEDYVYDGIWSDNYNTYIYTIVTRFKGSDSPRLLNVYQDQYDHQWYIFSDSWKSFCVDIKKPMIQSSATPKKNYIANDQPSIFSEEVDGKYVTINERTGIEEIKTGKFIQKRITFKNGLPSNATNLAKISRQGPVVTKDNQNCNVSDLEKDNGRFMVAALYVAALKAWSPQTADEVDSMMKILCESPTSQALGAEVYNNHSSQALRVSMKQNEKYKYLGNSYFDGTNPDNGYTMSELTVTVKDYVYDGVWSDNYESNIYTVVVQSSGADSPRLLKVYQDPFDLEWYIFSDSWKSLILDIRKPYKKSFI